MCKSPPMASGLPETPVPHHHECGPVQAQRYKRAFPALLAFKDHVARVCSLLCYLACKNQAMQLQSSSRLADGETEAQNDQDQHFPKASGDFWLALGHLATFRWVSPPATSAAAGPSDVPMATQMIGSRDPNRSQTPETQSCDAHPSFFRS